MEHEHISRRMLGTQAIIRFFPLAPRQSTPDAELGPFVVPGGFDTDERLGLDSCWKRWVCDIVLYACMHVRPGRRPPPPLQGGLGGRP